MKKSESVIKMKAKILPIPEAIVRIFGTVKTPPTLPDGQPKNKKPVSHRARKELLGLTKELRKVSPKGREINHENYKDFDLYLYCIQKVVQSARGSKHV